MTAWTHTPRVALYSHDTYGLGHLTRSTRIAAAVSQALPTATVLILTGSPVAHRFGFPPGVDYVKLPSVVKQGPDLYRARDLAISPRRIQRMRSQIIDDTLNTFQPDLLLVDNVPLGMKGELLPALRHQRSRNRRVKIHLNLRDILDAPDVIRESWESLGVFGVLDDIYDAINIFGTASVYDSIAAYRLPVDKSEMLGYIRAPEDFSSPLDRNRRPGAPHRILVTIGGGGDGEEILWAAIRMQSNLGRSSPYHLTLVPGPLMERATRTRVGDACRGLANMEIHDFVDDLPLRMKQSDVVVSMGGYNTMCEVMTVAQPSIVVPRTHPRREQEIRARALERHGLTRVVDPSDLIPDTLHATLQELLHRPTSAASSRPSLDGLPRFAQRLWKLMGADAARRPDFRALAGTDTGAEDQEPRSHSHATPARRRVRP